MIVSKTGGNGAVVAGGCCLLALIAYMYKRNHELKKQLKHCQKLLLEDNNDLQEEEKACVYLDYNGTTPIHPLVLKAMMPYFTTHFGNPSSTHYYGQEPKKAIHQARLSLWQLLSDQDHVVDESVARRVWFTGCGTESNHMAIQLALATTTTNPHVVTTNVEHPSVLRCLQDKGLEITRVPVEQDGRVTVDKVMDAIQDNTVLVTIMLANNESGAIMPIRDIALALKKKKKNRPWLHTDAAQACGKLSLSQHLYDDDLLVDMVTLVGHKMGAPKGVAALCVGKNVQHHNNHRAVLLHGGGQEFGLRGGTENVPYMVGMGCAATLARRAPAAQHMQAMRERLRTRLQDGLDDVRVHASGLPNTLSVGLRGVQSGQLLDTIGQQVAASAGAACHSGGGGVSSVLQAMNIPMEYATGTLRLTVGPTTTPQDIDRAASIIIRAAQEQRNY